jgi:hypothetical protein
MSKLVAKNAVKSLIVNPIILNIKKEKHLVLMRVKLKN